MIIIEKVRDYEGWALAYLQCKTKKEFAERINRSYALAKRICNEPEFQEALNRVRQQAFDKAMKKAQIFCDDAITELHKIGMSEDTPPTAKVSALKEVISASLSSYEISEIEPILQKIRKESQDA